jgi:hypothetical protein
MNRIFTVARLGQSTTSTLIQLQIVEATTVEPRIKPTMIELTIVELSLLDASHD